MPRFQQGLLLPLEIELMLQQQPDFHQHILHIADFELIATLGGRQELAQLLQQRHILREAVRDVGFQYLENAAFAIPVRPRPGESQDRAGAAFLEDRRIELHRIPVDGLP